MKIVFILYYKEDEDKLWNLSKDFYGNCLFYYYSGLKKRLEEAGHEVFSRREIDICKADAAVFCDIDEPLYELAESMPEKIRKILFCNESPVYTPFAHHAKILNSDVWDDVITYNKSFSSQKIHHVDIPVAGIQVSKYYQAAAASEKNPEGVIVASCKNDFRGELFKRDRMLKQLAVEDYIHIYGSGWGRSKNVFGKVPDKLEVMSRYKYALVIENSIYPGYLTEKLCDAILSGLPSIYYGDFESAQQRFAGTFVKLEELTAEAFRNSLSELERNYGRMIENIKDAQKSSVHWADSFFNTFMELIEKYSANPEKDLKE